MQTTTLSGLLRIGLHIFGIWPYVPSTAIFRLYWIIMLSTAQVFQYRYLILNIRTEDFSEYIYGVSATVSASIVYIQLIILWTNERVFFDLVQMMSADWRDYTSRNCNSRVMTNTADLARRTSKWIIGLQMFTVMLYGTGVLAANASDPERLEPYARELILKMQLPFNISTNFIYTTVQTVQFYHLFLVVNGFSIVNSLLLTLILHVGGQIDILREWLLNVFSKSSAHSVDKITFESLITKHQQIITFSENIENLYTYIALIVLLSNTIVICCVGYIIVISIGVPNAAIILLKFVLFYLMVNLGAFIYCFAGEYLSAKSKLIGNAAYDSLWYNRPIKESKIILFVIIRSQKTLTITSGRIVVLSLDRFTSVLKASASYISVLLAMY